MTAKPLRVLVCARYPAVSSGLRELLTSSGIDTVEWAPARRSGLGTGPDGAALRFGAISCCRYCAVCSVIG